MHGVVPAAGRGTRLRPLTDDRPKGLVDVGGRPLLDHVFETLRPHVELLAVVVGYRGEQIREHYGDSYRGTPVRYVEQANTEGLAHAVQQTEPLVDGPFLQLNGDNVLRGNVDEVVDVHRESGADATLLVDEVSPERAARGGVVELEDGDVVDLVEKPEDPPSRLATTGCFAFSPRIYEACRAVDRSERGEYELTDAIRWLLRNDGTVETVRFDGWRVNVNERGDVERAEAQL
ncbi:nucleotidyltransferase family protein [Natronomonas salina]|uniref:nucleotidyltransferase family protein n=1 Tax=Natronomonas salina TaxID=1710540 RepID=UPI0015B63E58|nr:nucleotidyltransferase family protein [Natronomonas salina]QLD87620.1 nucleotidyltransferase family protein [Natronomonas salina]